MIAAKRTPQSEREKKEAYELVTLRDAECVRCRRGVPNRHHRQGRDPFNSTPANLILLCGSGTTGCHGWAHSHPVEARQHGIIVPSWADPAEVPILLWRKVDGIIMRRAWALLPHDGSDPVWIGPREAGERMERIGVAAARDDRRAG